MEKKLLAINSEKVPSVSFPYKLFPYVPHFWNVNVNSAVGTLHMNNFSAHVILNFL